MPNDPVMKVTLRVTTDEAQSDVNSFISRNKEMRFDPTFSGEGRTAGSFSQGSGAAITSGGGPAGFGGGADARIERAKERQAAAQERLASDTERKAAYTGFGSPGAVELAKSYVPRGFEFAKGRESFYASETPESIQFRQKAKDRDKLVSDVEAFSASWEKESIREAAKEAKLGRTRFAARSAVRAGAGDRLDESYAGSGRPAGLLEGRTDTGGYLADRGDEEDERNERILRDTGEHIRTRAFGHAASQERKREARHAAYLRRRDADGPSDDFEPDLDDAAAAEARAYPKDLGKKGKKGEEGMQLSGFYKRFLAMETLQAVGSLGKAYTDYHIGIAGAAGNQTAILQAELNLEDSLAAAIPFGIGQLGATIREAYTGKRASIAASQASVNIAEQGMTIRQASAERRYRLGESISAISTSRGVERDVVGIRNKTAEDIRARKLDLSAENHEAEVSRSILTPLEEKLKVDYTHGGPSGHDRLFVLQPAVEAERTRHKDALKKLAEQQDADIAGLGELGRRTEEDRRRQNTVEISNIYTAAAATYGGAIAGARPAGEYTYEGINSVAGKRAELLRQQDSQRIETSGKFKEERDSIGFSEITKLLPTVVRQMADSYKIITRQQQDVREFDVQSGAITGSTLRSTLASTAAIQATLDRNPLERIKAERNASLSRNELIADPSIRDAADKQTEAEFALKKAQQQDRRDSLSRSLVLSNSVSALQATAYGPGADRQRRAAALTGIAGSAELEAQGFLNDRNLGNDRQRGAFANAARQGGINNLQAYRANYIENELEATNINPFLTNFSPRSGTSPSAVLGGVNAGIKALQGNINTTPADPISTTPALNRVLDAIVDGMKARS
jgi:hypothetical protein